MKRMYLFFCYVLMMTVGIQAQDSIASGKSNIRMANQLYS